MHFLTFSCESSDQPDSLGFVTSKWRSVHPCLVVATFAQLIKLQQKPRNLPVVLTWGDRPGVVDWWSSLVCAVPVLAARRRRTWPVTASDTRAGGWTAL